MSRSRTVLLHTSWCQGMGCLNWSRPVKESVSDRQTDRSRAKEQRERTEDAERKKRQEGPASSLITEALADP
ncbi:hypothetical protein EYF80_009415 [Liparis tanakae]|uniref:Uncharacterized protein n=1 Tax=Liparis tanakae TaxID=230148 RepID=A0A4Z2IRD3_9TELE|nr:hypothetical protein EYF80_009415 [Liparis tanakae]